MTMLTCFPGSVYEAHAAISVMKVHEQTRAQTAAISDSDVLVVKPDDSEREAAVWREAGVR